MNEEILQTCKEIYHEERIAGKVLGMKKFDFDYTEFQWYYKNGDKIPLHEIRKGLVCEYLFITLSEKEFEMLTPNYISALGEYILYALDKDIKKGLLPMTGKQFKVLCQQLMGTQGFLRQDVKDKQKTYYFVYDEERMSIIKQNENPEFLQIIEDQKNTYYELLDKVPNRYKKTIRTDITDTDNFYKKLFVKSKDDVSPRDKMLDISQMDEDIDYSDFKVVKSLLKDYDKLSHSDIGSMAHCIYLDLSMAIKKCKFTEKQKETLIDFIKGRSEHELQVATLNYAIMKIIKKLS